MVFIIAYTLGVLCALAIAAILGMAHGIEVQKKRNFHSDE